MSLAVAPSVFALRIVPAAVRRARTSPEMCFSLNAAIRASFNPDEPLLPAARRALLNFGRFADDRRRPFLAFECLAKTVG